jgi:hypothetical protein
LTILFMGVGVGAVTLLITLELGPLPTVAGGLVYAFSAYVVANAGGDAAYLAALGLAPALTAWVLRAAHVRSLARWLAAMVPAAIVLGVVIESPPMALACVASILIGLALMAWLNGWELFQAAFRRTTLGVAVLVAVSAYWLTPYLIQLFTTPAARLAEAVSWTATEGRANLANGFWLNNSGGWNTSFLPYAHWYQDVPLVFVKYLVPVAAFASLGIGGVRVAGRDVPRLRLIAASSVVALLVVFLSTGTQFPGSPVFGLLYARPYGWLLRDPGRYLFIAGIAYAILIAIGLESATAELEIPQEETRSGDPKAHRRLLSLGTIAIVAVLVLPGLPLISGAITSGSPSSHLPSRTVVPKYWESMAGFVNRAPESGNLLVLPEDNLSDVPYTWYHGSDDFIVNLMSRNVIDPNAQTLSPPSKTLFDAVHLFQRSLLAENWSTALELARALNTRALLVRSDVQTKTAGNHLSNPAQLASSLSADPDVRLADQQGPLKLFVFRQSLGRLLHPVLVNSSTPDLKVLTQLPSGSALVTSHPNPHVTSLTQLTPIESWTFNDGDLETSIPISSRSNNRIATTSGPNANEFVAAASGSHLGSLEIRQQTSASENDLLLSLPLGESRLPDGTFTDGGWGQVGNCAGSSSATARPLIAAHVSSNGGPGNSSYLSLSALRGSACESREAWWIGGAVEISLAVRHVAGAPPRLCLFETVPYKPGGCALERALPSTATWSTYSALIHPQKGAKSLILFLYGDGSNGKIPTTNEYADVRIYDIPVSSARYEILSRPTSTTATLVVEKTAYSSQWAGPSGTRHVLVDGLFNGWLGSTNSHETGAPHYALANVVLGSDVVSAVQNPRRGQ